MDLSITSIHEKGKAGQEYVWLSVAKDCNLSYYCIADTTYTSPDKISNKSRHFYWWNPKAVKAGEMILLRTEVGTDRTYKDGSTGKTVHEFYWGLRSAVWNNEGDAALLFQITTWKATKA